MTKLPLCFTIGSLLLLAGATAFAAGGGRVIQPLKTSAPSWRHGKKPEMVYVPGGEFFMGHNPPGFEFGPVRRVTVDSFWIGKNDVTVSQFADYCEATGTKFDWDGRRPAWGWDGKDDRPMVNVTWDEAIAYCKWAGGDLPTDAQWEKAARGTDARAYPWGNDWAPNRAWYREGNDSIAEPAPVGSFPKGVSPFGCLDMAGNVAQWCKDWFGAVDVTEVKNPVGPGFGTKRVIRGGDYHDRRTLLISWVRSAQVPKEYSTWTGFRLVSLKP
jgi:formylglycine-generating enzyme required for sulfatase activity